MDPPYCFSQIVKHQLRRKPEHLKASLLEPPVPARISAALRRGAMVAAIHFYDELP